MGIVADTVQAAGGDAIGVIPHAMVAREIAHRGYDRGSEPVAGKRPWLGRDET